MQKCLLSAFYMLFSSPPYCTSAGSGSTQPPVRQWPKALSWGQGDWDGKLTTHLCPTPSLKIGGGIIYVHSSIFMESHIIKHKDTLILLTGFLTFCWNIMKQPGQCSYVAVNWQPCFIRGIAFLIGFYKITTIVTLTIIGFNVTFEWCPIRGTNQPILWRKITIIYCNEVIPP